MNDLRCSNAHDLKCPKCGYVFIDSWELPASDTLDCRECGVEIFYDTDVVRWFNAVVKEEK